MRVFTPHPHALRRNISAASSRVFITCPRGSIREPSLICSSYPRSGRFLVTPRAFHGARHFIDRDRGSYKVSFKLVDALGYRAWNNVETI